MSALLQQRIFDVLVNNTPIIEAVGDRIFTGLPAQDARFPQIAIMIDNADFEPALDGATTTRLETGDVTVSIWGDDLLAIQRIADIVVSVLDQAVTFALGEVQMRQDFDVFDKRYSIEIDAVMWNYLR
jgi:hypothetical protein